MIPYLKVLNDRGVAVFHHSLKGRVVQYSSMKFSLRRCWDVVGLRTGLMASRIAP